jgi:hypothetical protein
MARLQRFQESGLISADVPRLDFANLREEAKGYGGIAEGLDKISSFAFGKVKEKETEANKILGIQLRADSELGVQKEIDRLSGMADRGELPYDQAQLEVQALQGFARGMADAGHVEQASGLMRSISTSGNALLRKVSEVEGAKYGAEIDVKSAELVRALGKNMQDVWNLYRNGQMNEEEVVQYEAGARGVMVGMAGQSKDTVKRYLDADGLFEKARLAARNNTMVTYFNTPEFAARPSDALTKLRAGDAGVFSPVWGRLDEGQRDSLVQTMLKRQADDLTILDRDNKLSIERNRAANYESYNRFYSGAIGGDELLADMSKRGYIPSREELRQIKEGDVPGAPDQYFGGLEFKAKQGQISLVQANELFEQRRISLKQRNGLFAIIDKTEDQALSRGKEKIRNAFVPNPLDPSTREGAARRAEVESHLLGMLQVAERDGKPFDIEATADILIAARKKQADFVALEDDRERLRKKLSEIGLEYSEDYTLDSLKRSKKGNAKQHETINKIINSIKKNR